MKTLGTTTTYDGTEHLYLRGLKVRIVAVLKNALRADYDSDRAVHPRRGRSRARGRRDRRRPRGGAALARSGGTLQLRVERSARHRPRVLREPDALTT